MARWVDTNLKAIEEFRALKFGLLTPERELIPVPMYGHFGELKKRPEFRDSILSFQDRISEAEWDYSNSIPADEHPAWHCFESWRDGEEVDLAREIIDTAYKLGWARLGLFIRNTKAARKNRWTLEVESSEESLMKLSRCIKDTAAMLNADLEMTPLRVTKWRYGAFR